MTDSEDPHEPLEPPRYGVRVPGHGATSGAHGSHRGTPTGAERGSGSATGAAAPASGTGSDPRAARRAGRGLSFTAILLGALLALGLLALDVPVWWLGVLVAALGVVGYVLVQCQILPAFRDPNAVPMRHWSKLWLIPSALLLVGLAGIGVSFVVPGILAGHVAEDLLDDYALAFVVGGMTMVVGAGLGFGLVAMALLTRPDDDDSPLRPTDYAQRLRERERRSGPGDYYDSDWIRRGPPH